MKRKIILWVFFLSVAFFFGSLGATIPLYKLALKNQPTIAFTHAVPTPQHPASAHRCEAMVVYWLDATIYTKGNEVNLDQDLKNLMGHNVSFGCGEDRGDVILLTQEFSDGKPDTFLLLPKAWILKVIWLKPIGGRNAKTP